jgi:hypothetical protein
MRKTIFSLAVAALLAAAPAAGAQADRTGTVSASSPLFAWDGGPGTSVGANAGPAGGISAGNLIGCFEGIADCENTLLKVEAPGKLKLFADAADDTKDVLDMYLYETNEAGEFDDQSTDLVEGAGASETGDEHIDYQVKPGYYMVHIKFFLADADTYKGTAELTGFPAPAKPPVTTTTTTTAPAPTAEQPAAPQPQPAAPAEPQNADQPAAKKKSKKAACQKKAKKIKNKAKRKKALKKCAKLR